MDNTKEYIEQEITGVMFLIINDLDAQGYFMVNPDNRYKSFYEMCIAWANMYKDLFEVQGYTHSADDIYDKVKVFVTDVLKHEGYDVTEQDTLSTLVTEFAEFYKSRYEGVENYEETTD